MENAARKFDTSKSEDAQIVSGPEKTAEKPKSPEEVWSGKYWDRIKAENPDPKNADAIKKDTERIISGQLEKAAEILGSVLGQVFEANKEKFRGINLNPKEILSKFDKKKLFGAKTKNFLGGMAVGAVTRASVKWATGLAGGVFVGAASGAIAGGTWEGIKAYRGETKKHRELFARKEELYNK